MKVESILIIGGGTAGMMTAAFLSKNFPSIKIQLIESKQVGTIGVGESAVGTLGPFLRMCGLADEDWMNEASATYKYGGRFMNWSPTGDHFVLVENESNHILSPTLNLQQYLVSEYRNDLHQIKNIHITEALARDNRSPYFQPGLAYTPLADPLFSVGSFNFDAKKLADVLRTKAVIPNGVEIFEGDVKEVKLDEFGFIKQVKMVDRRKFQADLYIDCSGFKAALIEKVMDEPFHSFSDSLFCDRAIAMPIPYREAKHFEMRPYTTMTTMNSGWSWHTPIFDRIGTGYVYSSNHISDEDAEAELRSMYNHYEGEVLKIKMRIGTRERVAVKNVIACGLAGGFAEPMESTGISTFQGILATLGAELDRNQLNYNSEVIQRLNSDNVDMMIDIRDFIVAHYIMCHRRDTPFWQDVHALTKVPDTLNQKLAVLSQGPNQLFRGRIFGSTNWFQWLWGTGFYQNLDYKFPSESMSYAEMRVNSIVDQTNRLLEMMPNHYMYLKKLYGRD